MFLFGYTTSCTWKNIHLLGRALRVGVRSWYLIVLSRLQAHFQSGSSLTGRIFWTVPSVRASEPRMLFEHLVDMRAVGESFWNLKSGWARGHLEIKKMSRGCQGPPSGVYQPLTGVETTLHVRITSSWERWFWAPWTFLMHSRSLLGRVGATWRRPLSLGDCN